MAISEKSRSALYQGLATIAGEDAVGEMLSYFPARDVEEPVTKEFLNAELAGIRTEIADVRTEVRTGLADLRTELADLRTETQTGFADLRTELADVRTELFALRADTQAGLAGMYMATQTGLAGLETESRTGLAELRTEMHKLANRSLVTIVGVLLTAIGVAVSLVR